MAVDQHWNRKDSPRENIGCLCMEEHSYQPIFTACCSVNQPVCQIKKQGGKKKEPQSYLCIDHYSTGLPDSLSVVIEVRLLSVTSDRGVVTSVQHHLTSSKAHHKTSVCCQIQAVKTGRICSFHPASGFAVVMSVWSRNEKCCTFDVGATKLSREISD